MKSFPILVILALSLFILSCRETFGEQEKGIKNESVLPSQKGDKEVDSLPGNKGEKPGKAKPTRKKTKARDTLKPSIAVVDQLD